MKRLDSAVVTAGVMIFCLAAWAAAIVGAVLLVEGFLT